MRSVVTYTDDVEYKVHRDTSEGDKMFREKAYSSTGSQGAAAEVRMLNYVENLEAEDFKERCDRLPYARFVDEADDGSSEAFHKVVIKPVETHVLGGYYGKVRVQCICDLLTFVANDSNIESS
ncbi:hypothetical protein Tcan_14861 [Toxocara canis]|uniref:Uncharacterized protein n=1 Tax=Toxocara canis TaxID=6265 RepID=A0A0B2VL17_TOXCA|nr:hypothetical protein Tcan_14861 [Toxocara canis]